MAILLDKGRPTRLVDTPRPGLPAMRSERIVDMHREGNGVVLTKLCEGSAGILR